MDDAIECRHTAKDATPGAIVCADVRVGCLAWMSPRRPNDLTPAEPSDDGPAPRDTPAPLPRPPTPPRSLAGSNPPGPPRPPRLPEPAAIPGRRSDTPSDMQMTKRIPRIPGRGDPTPAPLPPSPGAGDAERWFEQVPTNPAHIAELAAENTGGHRKVRHSSRVPLGQERPDRLIERPWVLPTLIAAIALTIGMILGGLLFGGGGAQCEPCDDASRSGEEHAAPSP